MQWFVKCWKLFVLTVLVITIGTVVWADTPVFINELHYDNDGGDTGEAFEIAGPAGTDLTGWSVVLYNGNGGGMYGTVALSGIIPDQQDGFGTLSFLQAGIQNGSPDGLALIDAGSAVVQFLSYEGSFAAADGPAVTMTSTDIVVSEPSNTPVGYSLQLTGTGTIYEDFIWASAMAQTFGSVNTDQEFGGGSPDVDNDGVENDVDNCPLTPNTDQADSDVDGVGDICDNCPDTPNPGQEDSNNNGIGDVCDVSVSVSIYDIQYSASGDSPYLDQIVTTEGIVTASFYNGFFLEDPAGGAWNGVFVYDTSNTPALGDSLRLTGMVDEYNGLTELKSITSYVVLSSGNPVPAPVLLPTGDVSQEQWEGVLVRVEDVVVSDEDMGYGEWSVTDGTGDVVIDDKGDYAYIPANGDAIDAIIGPLDYSFGAFKILPRDDNDIILPAALVINEIDYDQPDTDTAEFIEIKNISAGSVNLDPYSLVLINGNGGAPYKTIDLPDIALAADDYFVVCANLAAVDNCDMDVSAQDSNLIQNGAPDAVALLLDNSIVDTVSYEGSVTGYTEGSGSGLSDDSSMDSAGISRFPDGTDTDQNNVDFSLRCITPGEANTAENSDCGQQPVEACGDPFTPIYDIQGNGPTSPLVGNTVSFEGVVVGDFQSADELDGFFVQDPQGDGNVATSDGIFVFAPGNTDISVGQTVRVAGKVIEYSGMTQVGGGPSILVCGTGTVAPTPVDLPVPAGEDLEPYEGMLLTFPEALTVSQNYFQGRYGQVTLSAEGRLYQPTNQYLPNSPEAIALADENIRRMLVLDDGQDVDPWGDNPAPIPYIGADNTLRAGDTVTGLTGVLDYGLITTPSDPNYHYRLHPTESVDFTRVNERTDEPEEVGGTVKVASFNVLNYFNGDGLGGGFPTSRGADSMEEFTRQRDKIIAAIIAMDADIVGLMEIENDGYGPNSAIQDLVNGLNEATGANTYAFIDPGVPQLGADEITVGFIYNTGMVLPYGPATTKSDGAFADRNRQPLVQTFEELASGEKLTVAVNHFKSKGSACDDIGDPDTGDGQGNCNLTRVSAANELTAWLATDPTGSGDADFLIIGDLNSYAMEDPIMAIESAGYTNLVKMFGGTEAYSYVFDGQAGYLDHALASPSLTAQVAAQFAGATEWHINTDEPAVIDYNTDFKPEDLYMPTPYRASDHDPVLIGLNLVTLEATKTVVGEDHIPGTNMLEVLPGDIFTYTIEFENPFEQPVFFTVSDVLDNYLQYDEGSFAYGDGYFATGDLEYGILLDAGVPLSLSFDVAVLDSAPIGYDLFNSAWITATYNDAIIAKIATNLTQVKVVPEPGTLLSLGIGLLGIVMLVRRHRKQGR